MPLSRFQPNSVFAMLLGNGRKWQVVGGESSDDLNSSFTVIHDNDKSPLDYITQQDDYSKCTTTTRVASPHSSSNSSGGNNGISNSSVKRKRRKVQFDESLNKTHESILECQEDCKSLWYSAEECKALKAAYSALARDVIDEAENSSSYCNDGSCPFSYHSVMHRTYDACCRVVQEDTPGDCVLTLQDAEHLRECMKLVCGESTRIGLERVAIRSIARDRLCRYREMVSLVSTIQQMESSVDSATRTEFIRSSSASLSLASRLFALYLAQAQADNEL
jgi:hypothetical protein